MYVTWCMHKLNSISEGISNPLDEDYTAKMCLTLTLRSSTNWDNCLQMVPSAGHADIAAHACYLNG